MTQTQRFSSWLMLVLSALVSACTLPTVLFGVHLPDLSFLAWLSLVPLFLALRQSSVKRAWWLGFVWSLIYYGISLYWIYHAVHVYGGFGPVLSTAVTALLVLMLSLYLPLASSLAVWLGQKTHISPSWWFVPAWVLAETVRASVPAQGFPWAHLALSQWQNLPVLQLAEYMGVPGLIFLLVFVNALLAESLFAWHQSQKKLALRFAVLLTLLLLSTWSFGAWRQHHVAAQEELAAKISIGLVQANISQDEKWDGHLVKQHLERHQKLSAQLAEHKTDLIVWPETSFPQAFPVNSPKIPPEVLGLSATQSAAVLFGVITEDHKYIRNSALLYNSQGEPLGSYHKIHLVPFGEYVPWQNLLSFAKKLTEPVGTFVPGKNTVPLLFGNIRIAPLICFEDIFPEPARTQVFQGADLLVNLTNDAWYGNTSAAFQHLGLSVFRAVENRRSLVRAANTGISAFVAPSGRVVTATPLFTEAVLAQPVPLLSLSTFYQRFPWLVPFACFFILLVAGAWGIFGRNRGNS